VRTEGAPLSFAGTSVTWTGKLWVKDCDLAASLDLLVGEKSTVIGFNQAELKSRSRILAVGDIRLGLGDAGTTLKLAGDLGALAEQPFGGPLNIVTGGQYRATADRAQNGEINIALQVQEVKGFGRQKNELASYSGGEFSQAFLPKVELNIWVQNARLEEVLLSIERTCRTGRMGDGKILVFECTQPAVNDSPF
jgi:nitrogen regulatory protein P-II 1